MGSLQAPNVMIKIPATAAGIPAIEECIADGLNINVTLIFSLASLRRGDGRLPRAASSGASPRACRSIGSRRWRASS